MLTGHGQTYFDRLFTMSAAQRVVESVGENTFKYVGAQAIDVPQITVWRFQMYGGIVFSGDTASPEEASTEIGVLTGPRKLIQNMASSAESMRSER